MVQYTSYTEASFLDLHLLISYDIVSSKIDDKRDNFEIVNFSFSDGVYTSQLIRFARTHRHLF